MSFIHRLSLGYLRPASANSLIVTVRTSVKPARAALFCDATPLNSVDVDGMPRDSHKGSL